MSTYKFSLYEETDGVYGADQDIFDPMKEYAGQLDTLSKSILNGSQSGNSEQRWKGGDTGTLAQGKPYNDPQTESYYMRSAMRARGQDRDSMDNQRVNRYQTRMFNRQNNGSSLGGNIPTSGNPNNIPTSGDNSNNFSGLDDWKGRQKPNMVPWGTERRDPMSNLPMNQYTQPNPRKDVAANDNFLDDIFGRKFLT